MPQESRSRKKQFINELKSQKPVTGNSRPNPKAETELDDILSIDIPEVEARAKPYIKYIYIAIAVFVIGFAARNCSTKPSPTEINAVNNSATTSNPYESQALERMHLSTGKVCFLKVQDGDTRQTLSSILIVLGDGVAAFAKSGYGPAYTPQVGDIIFLDQNDCLKRNIQPSQ